MRGLTCHVTEAEGNAWASLLCLVCEAESRAFFEHLPQVQVDMPACSLVVPRRQMVWPGRNLECQGRFLQPRNACTWGPRLVPWPHMRSSIEERKETKNASKGR